MIRHPHQSGHTPRRSLGQHFLINQHDITRIVSAVHLTPRSTVIEIGPGLGALTRRLVASAHTVIAVELDSSLVAQLPSMLGFPSNLKMIHADILKVRWEDLLQHAGESAEVVIVANLPYYITSAAIRHILEGGCPYHVAVLTVQWEVAERIVAKPPEMNLLALSVQFYAQPEILFRIPPSHFHPAPAVHSAVVRLKPHSVPQPVSARQFFRWARAGFSQPRKQLRNTLSASLRVPKSLVESMLEQCQIDPSRRPESLSFQEWLKLAGQPLPEG